MHDYKVRVIRTESKITEVEVQASSDEDAIVRAGVKACNIDFSQFSYGDAEYTYEVVSKSNKDVDKFFKMLKDCDAVILGGDVLVFPQFNEVDDDFVMFTEDGTFELRKSEVGRVNIHEEYVCVMDHDENHLCDIELLWKKDLSDQIQQ